MTSDEMGGILLDGSCSPVCDRVGSPTFLPPSYRSEFRFVGWRFARRVVTAHVGSCRSADFSTPSETHLPYILESLANWLLLCRSWRPVSDGVGPATFLPSLKTSSDILLRLPQTDFRFVGWRFARRVVTARVRSCRSADISTRNPPAIYFGFSRELTSSLSGGVLQDRSWRPVTHRIGPLALQASLKPTYHIFQVPYDLTSGKTGRIMP